MNEADDTQREEELFLSLMADCDESLASGAYADVLAAVPAAHQPRLHRNLALIRLVRQVLGRPAVQSEVTPDPPTLPAPQAPPRLGRFQIQKKLGRGGMGVVYRAFDSKRDQLVALKSLPGLEPTALYRFKREFRSLADVSHPNLVALYELFAEGGQWFFSMELVPGVDFLSHVREASQVPPVNLERLRGALRQLAEGVAALHDAGKLHRDIKPGNVLVTPAGRVVLLDFGLAADLGPTGLHASSEPHILGTISYLSPEQGAGLPLGPASDWYSVGVMLYVALTGRLPFRGSALQIIHDKAHGEPPAPHELVAGAPEDLDQLCIELLRREPCQRPSGPEVLRRLARPGTAPAAKEAAPLPQETGAPLVGRELHLQALAEAFAAVKGGRPVTMYLCGPSGAGKTALAQSFLSALRQQDQAVILTGQCFEQESVPYKAFDGLADALSDYLGRLQPLEVQALLPRDVTPLAQIFPVLRRVEFLNAAAQRMSAIPDPQEIRRRAFAGLRELLARLGDRRPLVLFIDDLQWGDLDSAALLPDLLRPPDPPVLLFLGCYRSEETETSHFLCELLRPRGAAAVAPDRRELSVAALQPGEAQSLARRLLAEDATTALAEAIARESDGNPFFVHALVHQVRARQGGNRALVEDVSFNKAFSQRMASLPEEGRRLLEVVVVAGRPLAEQDACQAAELGAQQLLALTALRSHRLVRAVAGTHETGITTYHDRVREAVLSRLSPAVLREHHQRLAHVLERSGRGDPEVLAVHFHGANERERAAGYYTQAADRAAQTLAFDRAARLYRLALELWPVRGEQERLLRSRLGDALANAGRGAEAAPEFLAAAAGAPPLEALHLRQRAALQYLVSGHVEEGLSILGEVLAAVGLKLPPTPRRALLALLLRRARLWLRGLRFRARAAGQVAVAELTRIDICYAATAGITAFDNILGAGFQSLELLLALRAGEPARVARALAGEAILSAMGGGPTARRTARVLALAEQIRPRVDDPRLSGMLALARGMAAHMQGQWHRAADGLAAAEQIFRERCRDVRWGINVAQALGQYSLYMQGQVAEVSRRLPAAIDEARGRGDLHALAFMLALHKPYVQLAADQPHEDRRDLDALGDAWRLRRYSIPHFMVDFVHVQVDLYLGDVPRAVGHLDEMWRRLRPSLHLRGQLFRILTSDLRARVALAVAATAPNARPHLRAAHHHIRLLQRERMPWGEALAQLLCAGVAARRHDRIEAVRLLREAVERLEAVDMHLHAAAARRRLGELLGGGEGRELVARADAWMATQKIANPARMTDMHAPGFAGL
jgi:hypothetical protein